MAQRALFVDDIVPRAGWGAGYTRGAQIVRALSRCSERVDLCPMMERSLPEAPGEIFADNVRPVSGCGMPALRSALKDGSAPGLLWVGRPHNLARVFRLHRTRPELFSGMRIVYDAEAVFASRTIGLGALKGTPLTRLESRDLLREELRPAQIAHAIVCVSAQEQRLIREIIGATPALIACAAPVASTPRPFHERRDLLFLGALWDEGSPNADSMRFFIERVLPIIAAQIDARLRIAGSGSDGAAWLQSISGPGIEIAGPVDDLGALFDRARVFVAPTRFGAGIPHKVVDAARHGVPVVATSLLAAQLGWRDGRELLVADEPAAMADACVRLWRDERLWARLREAALAAVLRDFDPAAFDAAVARVAWSDAPGNPPAGRQ